MPRQRFGRQLAVIALFDAVGSGMYYSAAALYFTKVAGLTPGQVGAGLSVGALTGLLTTVPVGLAGDRLKVGQVYICLQLARGLAFTAYCFATSFPAFAIVCALAGMTEAALPPVQQAVVGASVPGDERVDTLAKIRALRNVGFGIGALGATAAISQGSKTAFLSLIAANAASYYLVGAGLWRIGVARITASVSRQKADARWSIPNGRYVFTGLLSGVLSVHSTLLVVALPLWFVLHTPMPEFYVGILVAANTVLAATLQTWFARSSSAVPGAVRTALLAGLALAGFGIISQLAAKTSAASVAIVLAFAAVVLLTCAELWQSASGWCLAYELADAGRRTEYLSTFQLGQSLQAAAAPWLITALVFTASAGWLYFAAAMLAAGILTRYSVPSGRHGRPATSQGART